MLLQVEWEGKAFKVDTTKPLDISIPLRHGGQNPNAWYAPLPDFSPVKMGEWTGAVTAGAPVNFFNVTFNPHGNGTHTESVGHISKDQFPVQEALTEFFFFARLISIYPATQGDGDKVITKQQLEEALEQPVPEAVIIRTLPNDEGKMTRQYSNTNPAYLHHAAAEWLSEQGVKHLLLDLPSVDREEDEGKLLAHHAFWNFPEKIRKDATITELAFIPDSIKDGLYLLNLQIPSFMLDAAPSKPVLYELKAL